jgi:hypothetical protein
MFKKISVLFLPALCSVILSQSRFEISFNIGYSYPLLEARGNNLTIDSLDHIFINGKRLIDSDNLATNAGYNVTAFLKYVFTKNGHVKGLFSLGYNVLYGNYDEFMGYNPGIRIQNFSTGLGAEINPLGHNSDFYPSAYGLFRINFIGGETYLATGYDFLKVSSRYGYLAGINLNYRFKKTLGMYLGYCYSYDNPLNRQTEETYKFDLHVIPFRDKASAANGLTSDRRIAYWSLYLGMNFFFK